MLTRQFREFERWADEQDKAKARKSTTQYERIVKKRGFRELPYQKDFLTNPIYENPKNPLVLAAGTSSGKSFMAIMKLEIFYSNDANKNKRTLFIPASRTVLRDNIQKELEDFNPSFTYCVATNKKELLQAIKNKCNVIVALPQTIIKNVDSLPKFHNFILDEAHQWYFKSTIQNIIKKVSPKYQLLLTGTPSRFIAKGDKFLFKFVPVMELFDLKQVTNVKMEVVTSSYDFKQSDYLSAYGNLKSNVRMSDKQSDNALMVVCKEMIKKLKNPIKDLHNVNRLSKNVFSVFGELDKTIIFCHSLKQADAFYNSLNSFKRLKGKVLVSHSENDKDSSLFEQFRNDLDIKVLVAVDRGRLGYNMPELFNVVDFTLTQSLDMLLQMYGRVLRKSELQPNKEKIYYKVANKNDAAYNIVLMTAMFSLTHMKWYSQFNGKNMGQILIPKVITNFVKKIKQNNSNQKSKSKSKRAISLENLDIPLDLNLFNQSILHSNNDPFSTIGSTTLDDVRREFFNIGNYTKVENVIPFDVAKAMCKKHKIKNAKEYGLFVEKNKSLRLPKWPEITYKNEWVSYGDYLGTGFIASNQLKNYRYSFNEAKNIIKPFALQNRSDYKKFRNLNEENKLKFPANPDQIYKNEWISWGDFLGNGKVANQNKTFLSLNEAKKFLKDKNFEIHSWRAYTKSKDFPDFLPKDVYTVYGKDKNWKGLRDLFGTNNKWNGVYKK